MRLRTHVDTNSQGRQNKTSKVRKESRISRVTSFCKRFWTVRCSLRSERTVAWRRVWTSKDFVDRSLSSLSASVERFAAVVVADAFDESSDASAAGRTSAQTWDFHFRPVCSETFVVAVVERVVVDETVDGKDG